jgi:ferredoxin
LEDIETDERYQGICARQNCIGIFICFTAIRMIWVIKDDGESLDENFYRQCILTEKVIPFLSDPKYVLDPAEVVYLHNFQ